LLKRGIAFEELDNGFLSCEDPEALQEICDQLGPEQIQAFFNLSITHISTTVGECGKLIPNRE